MFEKASHPTETAPARCPPEKNPSTRNPDAGGAREGPPRSPLLRLPASGCHLYHVVPVHVEVTVEIVFNPNSKKIPKTPSAARKSCAALLLSCLGERIALSRVPKKGRFPPELPRRGIDTSAQRCLELGKAPGTRAPPIPAKRMATDSNAPIQPRSHSLWPPGIRTTSRGPPFL